MSPLNEGAIGAILDGAGITRDNLDVVGRVRMLVQCWHHERDVGRDMLADEVRAHVATRAVLDRALDLLHGEGGDNVDDLTAEARQLAVPHG